MWFFTLILAFPFLAVNPIRFIDSILSNEEAAVSALIQEGADINKVDEEVCFSKYLIYEVYMVLIP